MIEVDFFIDVFEVMIKKSNPFIDDSLMRLDFVKTYGFENLISCIFCYINLRTFL
jgi:hypothetical protein